ncbi:hypothetical protein NQ318_020462 [Aromia moschata]|uniref:Uncharacterized protein n=1 Tax=Aromia moschata TaxID=1265417 RepID=A0AAV8YJW7_9CUCU|nr:hypothetical protein NQ318_020462 [Aromia moschata]
MKKKLNMNTTLISPKRKKLRESLRNKKYKKSLNSERSNPLRSTRINSVSKKTGQREKGKKLRERKILNKMSMSNNQQRVATKSNVSQKSPSPASSRRTSQSKSIGSQCEVVTVTEKSEDQVDLENFMDDMIDFNNLSEEHKKCLIESRILSTKPITQISSTGSSEEDPSKSLYSLQGISPLYGFSTVNMNEVKKICEAYKNSSFLKNYSTDLLQDCLFDNDRVKMEKRDVEEIEFKTETEKSTVEKLASTIIEDLIDEDFADDLEENKYKIDSIQEASCQASNSPEREPLANGVSLQEHDYAGNPSEDDDEEKDVDVITVPNKNLPIGGCIKINPRNITKANKYELLPYNKSVEMKSLHRSLQYVKRKAHNGLVDNSFTREWEPDSSPKQKSKKQSHYISMNKENGSILKAFYIDYNLIVCQENVVSFWMQTPLGNVLGSQNMWIPRGETQRLVLNSKCVQKESMEMVIAMDTHVAYIELWTKEHKSDIREGPVADVFATVYFWKQRQNGLERKVLQLENINGFADDVQYSVMKCVPKIIVSWHSANEDSITRKTYIHAYQLATDYQTVSNIYDIEPIDHYVSSLHNIEDCDNLIMGCGENKITLWNVEYGYIVATVELTEIKSPLCTLWVKSDRGFLFALQQCVDRELRLIAINGINHSWKKLASYIPPEGFDRLRGVCIENGLLLSFYDQGILCWKAETGEPVEETNIETEIIPSGKYVILLEDNRILVKHAITHLMSVTIEDS